MKTKIFTKTDTPTKKDILDLFTGMYYEASDSGEIALLSTMESELEKIESSWELKAFAKKYNIKKLFRLYN